ncbi:MAG TPA: hypothetical protein VH186_14275 [Chloroflexia bacterium]|nr:hypothetical protein [Chloroflexia bacterium]
MKELLECTAPDMIKEEDLFKALTGSPLPAFEEHLTECAFCRQEIEKLRSLDRDLHQQFGFITSPGRTLCSEAQWLGDYALDLLPSVVKISIENHLACCPHCAKELQTNLRWLEESDTQNYYPPQTRDVETPGPLKALKRLRRVVAERFSPHELEQKALGNLRGNPEKESFYPLTYRADDLFITVYVQREKQHSSRLKIIGFLHSEELDIQTLNGANIKLMAGEQLISSEVIDELGNFAFNNIGNFGTVSGLNLEIVLEDRIIELQGIPAQFYKFK